MPTEPGALNKRFAGVVSKRLGLAVGLVGELGVGKSWLVRETIKTLTCSSRTVQASAPLSVLIRVLPRPTKLPTWVEKTLARPAETLELRALIDALVAVLSASAPFVLVIEDMHEAVPERLEFWNQVARAVRKARGVGVLLTTDAAETVHLGRILLEAEPYDTEALTLTLRGCTISTSMFRFKTCQTNTISDHGTHSRLAGRRDRADRDVVHVRADRDVVHVAELRNRYRQKLAAGAIAGVFAPSKQALSDDLEARRGTIMRDHASVARQARGLGRGCTGSVRFAPPDPGAFNGARDDVIYRLAQRASPAIGDRPD